MLHATRSSHGSSLGGCGQSSFSSAIRRSSMMAATMTISDATVEMAIQSCSLSTITNPPRSRLS